MLNMDAVNSSSLFKIIDQSSDAVTGSTESTLECEYEYNTRIRKEAAFDINGEIEEVHKKRVSMVVSAAITDIQQGDNLSTVQHPNIVSKFCENHALTNQNQDSIIENVDSGLAGPLDQSSNFLSGSMQIEKQNENSVETTAAVSTDSVLKEAQNDPEAFQHRGVPRRLQFEDALHTVINNQPAQSPLLSGGPKKSPLEAPQTPIKGKLADTMQPLYPRNMKTNVMIPKPSGIGLHLNSIVNAVQAGSGAIIHVKSAQRRNLSIRGRKPTPITNSHLSDTPNSSSMFTIAEDDLPKIDDDRHEGHASLAVNSVTSLSSNIVKSSSNSILLNPVDDQSIPGNKRMYPDTETDGNSEEFNSSPKKKRKKPSDPSDGDGCKRCNCKKSRCLKLYCDCFAAGMYCAEPCACQGCYNRPEYVDTVLETRQQIESRNPLAFAPKIVQNTIKPSARIRGENGTQTTPSSARHKRGCNCKKSMCLKKYCECYQANVGCSDGCGCEGCKNVYGQKGETDKYVSKDGANERTDDGSFVEKMMLSEQSGSRHSVPRSPHNLTPPTPAVQSSNQRKDEPKAWSNSGQHFQLPKSSLTSVTPYAITPGSGRSSEAAGEILDLVSYDQELYYGNSESLDEFSTVCHQPQNTGNLSSSKAQWFPGNNHYSSMSSLSWRGSPNTPMAQSCVSKPLKAIDLEGELSNTTQDDTPDILKDSSTPGNAVKVSSPNKKRVSPPHGPKREFGSSSLVGLRSGRKFILKAVSSFPPLTPCIDPKSTLAQQTSDPQNHTTNK